MAATASSIESSFGQYWGGGRGWHPLSFKGRTWKLFLSLPLHPIGWNLVTWPQLAAREAEKQLWSVPILSPDRVFCSKGIRGKSIREWDVASAMNQLLDIHLAFNKLWALPLVRQTPNKRCVILEFILLLIKNLNGKEKIKAGAAYFLGPAWNDRNGIDHPQESWKPMRIYHVRGVYNRNVTRGCLK